MQALVPFPAGDGEESDDDDDDVSDPARRGPRGSTVLKGVRVENALYEHLPPLPSQLWNVAALTGFQLAVPEEMRGRVLSMVFTLAQLGFVGILAVGALADTLGDQLALGIFGAIPTLLLTAIMLFGWKTLKQM